MFTLILESMEHSTPTPAASNRRQRVQSAETGLSILKALTRLATVYDIPMALNRATAENLIDFHVAN